MNQLECRYGNSNQETLCLSYPGSQTSKRTACHSSNDISPESHLRTNQSQNDFDRTPEIRIGNNPESNFNNNKLLSKQTKQSSIQTTENINSSLLKRITIPTSDITSITRKQ
ncbi:hypothetical protein KEM48_007817 [Puccinia striiformis f. sp. tritici PST-130]|nr:hypothetical protein KEM48_007817 [Puccinia striiformis f. sp. tritici PST-130]